MARYTVNAWRMLAPEIHSVPKSTKHKGRAQVVMGGTARETQVLFFTDAEAREWAMSGPTTPSKKRAAVSAGPSPVPLQKPTTPPTDFLADAWNTAPALSSTATPEPSPAAEPADTITTVATPPAGPDDTVVGLREAHEHHLPDITLAALRYARANDPTFPDWAGKRGTELLYRVGDLKRWARNRPRAGSGTTDLD
ncbi:hypothetical protein AB0K89_13905 [Streptomyces cinnamoneus]|uniref:hypothetical protein n=1 Tax=Streptomyces cinnamoneus TaxID=53446 RepID=UPI00344A783E